MVNDLTGRVAIVTGGSIGLGHQIAEALAGMGANVVLCARKKERCQEAADRLARFGVSTCSRRYPKRGFSRANSTSRVRSGSSLRLVS
jgi:NAD(P)-dependent dehydrogenase (short-subunit alcohol dehydrogenase family)